jgi:hypothetical protein
LRVRVAQRSCRTPAGRLCTASATVDFLPDSTQGSNLAGLGPLQGRD